MAKARDNKNSARLAGIAFAAAMIMQLPVQALAANGASIKGNWIGTGHVKLQSGNRERVSCRVKYGRIAGQEFSVNARCATAAAHIDQSGQLKRLSADRYVGNIHNEQFNVSARVTVTVSGGRQTVSITSDQGSATIRLKRR